MSFSIADIVLSVMMLGFAIGGLAQGFVKSVGKIIGFFAGLWLAAHYFGPFADWLSPIIGNHPGLAKVIAFIVIFAVASGIISLIVKAISKGIGVIPFLKPLDHLAGLILGAVEGILVMGLLVWLGLTFLPGVTWLYDALSSSSVAQWLAGVMDYFGKWILPEIWQRITSII